MLLKWQKIIKKKIIGINVHIGSLFLEPHSFHQAVDSLLSIAEKYPSINYIDFGGGFGIAYQEKEKNFPILSYKKKLKTTLESWQQKQKDK